ncbi:MAG TPA: glutamate racemase [Clostridia bacterium]|nr:glutamate racemase [Clostridia bacterium]
MKNIVVYDSGIGGISIYRQLKKLLPNADFVYYADNASFPYGEKSSSHLVEIALKNIGEIKKQFDTDLIVLACNTITCVAVDSLRKAFADTVFVGTEPSIKQAVQYSAGNILVAATTATVKNARVRSRFPQSNLIWLALPKLAEMVEQGEKDGIICDYIEKFAESVPSFDCVVLGCTHFTLIKDLFAGVFVGKKIFDGSQGVSQYVKNLKYKEYRNETQGITSLVLTDPNPDIYQKYLGLLREYT